MAHHYRGAHALKYEHLGDLTRKHGPCIARRFGRERDSFVVYLERWLERVGMNAEKFGYYASCDRIWQFALGGGEIARQFG